MGKLLTECFYFAKSNFSAILKLFGPYIIVTSLLSPSVELLNISSNFDWVNPLYLVVLSFLYTYLMARFIKLMAFTVSGYQSENGTSWTELWRLLIVYSFYGIAVLLGFIALIIPGLYLAAKYAFADFEAILNDKPAFSALNESWRDTKGITGKLMLATTLIGSFQLVIGFVSGSIGESLPSMYLVTEIFYEFISASTMIFMSIVYFRLYTESKSVENVSLEEKA